jgi:SAM-dependent methyltransferase
MDGINQRIENTTYFNIVTVAPANYAHSGTWDEISETLCCGLRDLGYPVSSVRNDINTHAKNIFLGGNLITPDEVRLLPEDSIIYNFEQLSAESPWLNSAYKDLLTNFEVWDYSEKNIAFLKTLNPKFVPKHIPLGYAESLERIQKRNFEDIDVLFYGSINERRQRILDGLEAEGLHIKTLFGCYGAERDEFISRSKVILNVHFYDTKIFEIVRLFYVLANKKAVVSELCPDTELPEHLENAVCFADYESLVQRCKEVVSNTELRSRLEASGYMAIRSQTQREILKQSLTPSAVPVPPPENLYDPIPKTLNIGSGKDFKNDCLNLDLKGYWNPDIVADLSDRDLVGREFRTDRFGEIKLNQSLFNRIICNDVIEHIPDVVSAMTNCLNLLEADGIFDISVPYDLSHGAWQDPTHVRAFNERSWLYYTDWHWYLGWTEARFDLVRLTYVASELGANLLKEGMDEQTVHRTPRAIDSMSVTLKKRFLTEAEKLRSKNISSR